MNKTFESTDKEFLEKLQQLQTIAVMSGSRDWVVSHTKGILSQIVIPNKSKIMKKSKKYFHTFRYQNGNVDRDITIAVVSEVVSEIGPITPYMVAVSYSVRTPEDRPEKLPYESEALKRSREIALKKISRKPLDQLVLPKEYAVERGVLRAIALKWERKIKKDGAHTYIKGVPAPDPESEVFRSESGKKIIVTRNETWVHVNVPASIGSKITPK